MCTLTFSPQTRGFLVVMNRDEQRSRIRALPPEQQHLGQRRALHPSEPGGGTWIGLSDAGTVFALLNWYSVPDRPRETPLSRGTVVPAVLDLVDPGPVEGRLAALEPDRIRPFRLVGVFPSADGGEVREWRWNGRNLQGLSHPWTLSHWISSGADESGAEQERRLCFARHTADADRGSMPWLARLHSSHEPAPGAYSICVHREDAATVSQTRIGWKDGNGWMEYVDGAPCEGCPPKIGILTGHPVG